MGKRLLLADDSVTIQKVVGISFASEDVELITVDNGNAAVERARELRPDVVLADVVMPGLNGYEVCEALGADPDLRHIPVLLLTGTFESFDEERAARCGAAGHVAKPFEAQALVDQVRMLLARSPEDAHPATLGNDHRAPASNADSFDFFEDGIVSAEPSFTGNLESSPGTDVLSFADDPSAAPVPDPAVALMQETFSPALAITRLEPEIPSEDSGENTAGDVSQETILDPKGASGFDISTSDLERREADLSSDAPLAAAPIDAFDAPGDARTGGPTADNFDPSLTDAADDPLGAALEEVPAEAFDVPLAEALHDPLDPPATDLLGLGIDDPLFPAGTEEPARVTETASGIADLLPATPQRDAGPDFAAPDRPADPTATTRWIPEPDAPTGNATHDAPAMAGAALAEIEPRLREDLHDTLEKIAWESLGSLSEQIVRQAVAQIEQIAWEVIPQLAETLVREEIRRMKGGEDD